MLFPELLETYVAPLYQHPCWHVNLGYGDQLTLDFGAPSLSIREPKTLPATKSLASRQLFARRNVTLRGEWRLWIHFCNWRVRMDGAIVGRRTDRSARRKERAAAALDGQIMTGVGVKPQTGATIFTFDLGGQLETLPYDAESEQWVLFTPSGQALVVRGDGCYSADAADIPPADTLWKRMAAG